VKRTKASLAKMVATRKANREKKLALAEAAPYLDNAKAAAQLLMQAERVMQKPYTEAELLSLMALRRLTVRQ
jgi:hypothetical protein